MQVDLYNGLKTAAVCCFCDLIHTANTKGATTLPSGVLQWIMKELEPVNCFLWLGSVSTLFHSVL